MSRIERLAPHFVDSIPRELQLGILYVSKKYRTASHLCCCGCGNRVVTPLKPGGWRLTEEKKKVSLDPSIGSWNLPCQSHYFIRRDRIVWAPQWSKDQIAAGREADRHDRQRYYDDPPRNQGTLERLIQWLKSRLGL
jgi:hypothetical protein